MVGSANQLSNRLIDALSEEDKARWASHLERLDLPKGLVLYESGHALTHAYFLTSGIVAKRYITQDGDTSELALIGREGVIGTAAILGGRTNLGQARMLKAGTGFRMRTDTLMREFSRSSPVTLLLLRYTQAYMTQMAQTAVCNRLHTLEKQLCRWLLMVMDRTGPDDILLTQEIIANMLGVRREGVTDAALRLQRAGIIRYARGRIQVLDRDSLLARSCECYRVVSLEYERLLSHSADGTPPFWKR
ncbi:MAG: Crp/Fnr family transcriptional regulator [Aquabacterium sp.]|uniref:Crp/Fnr family transcriptional regulator n=1 Tax=Aquabacterium sp. TaxID=1872578 RepID=UPI003BC9C0DC